MPTLRTLRRDRQLTLTDLAFLAGVPVRTLARAEHGWAELELSDRQRVATALGVPTEIVASSKHPRVRRATTRSMQLQTLVICLCACTTLAVAVLAALVQTPVPTRASIRPAPRPTVAPTLAAPMLRQIASERAPSPALATPQPTVHPATPTHGLAAAAPATANGVSQPTAQGGPRLCPLLAAFDRIVITQAYDAGTHTPAVVWGAIDLGVDTDGDGAADPDATRGIVVLAASGGVAHVTMDSWPGGNFIRITDAHTGWSTAYAHLDTVAVASGQQITTGTPIGTVGTTGMTDGPHLHYEVWQGDSNLDPTGFLPCGT